MALQLYTRTAEVKLREMLTAIGQPAGWHSVHFHLSDLLDQYKSEYQVKIAINLIHDLLKEYQGGIFLMVDQSIVVLCFGLERTLLNKLVFQLRYLYMDDPLAYTEDGAENPDFCVAYDLARDWQHFIDLVSKRMALSVRYGGRDVIPDVVEEKFSASVLASIEQDLRRADLSKVLRRQPVCAAQTGGTMRHVFDELYIHIAHLRQMLKAEVDFFSNRWLFKYMTHILDERMIELIRDNPKQYLGKPVSLNLNVETLLSSWFDQFDAALAPEMKVSVVIEVPVVDVFADIDAFMVAKDTAKKLGYRLCLDGLTVKSFVNISREKLGPDLVKVQWNADVVSDLRHPESRDLAEAVQATGVNRVILCRCDDKNAVEYGQAMGISLFQGRYIDALLNPSAKVKN